jgi:cadmium resistance protein CadD (predicted permease)
VFIGYFAGMSLVLMLSVAIGLVGYIFPTEYLGYLGAIPIALGIKMLADKWRRRNGETEAVLAPAIPGAAVGGIALTMLSNGVDSVLVFAPLLADSNANVDLAIAAAFLLMVCLWFRLAIYATTHASRVSTLQAAGEWIAPIVMIIVGWYILDNTITDITPGS